MKRFVVEHWRAIVIIAILSYLATVLAGGSIVASYATTLALVAIWLWREREKFS